MNVRPIFAMVIGAAALTAGRAWAVDQTVPGAGNARAIDLANKSPMVRSARTFLSGQIAHLRSQQLRQQTEDAVENPETCVWHRIEVGAAEKTAILAKLISEGLVNTADDATFPGGLKAGVFPPLRDDGSRCPKLPQAFFSAPGSVFGGHHSYPGGLPIHETFNDLSFGSLTANYRRVYGNSNGEGLPQVGSGDTHTDPKFHISDDLTLGAPIWHDWAKPIVFQWNADGTEFAELNFGGSGTNDAWGSAGDSRTGAHHIIGVAESMKRGLPPEFVITQACAHSNPTSSNEYKVVNWLRAGAIMARIDAVAAGYLRRDSQGRLRLPALRRLSSIDLNAASGSPPNLLIEYTSHNLSDADFTFTGPAVTEVELLLKTLAAQFGFNPTDTANYNNKFRNPVLSLLTAERLTVMYAQGGLEAVAAEVQKLRSLGFI